MPQQTMPAIKDVRVEVKVRNNLILTRMEHRNIRSVAQLCREMNLSKVEERAMLNLVNMTLAARNAEGKWHGMAYKLADFFDCTPEDLFSEMQQEVALEKNRSYAEISFTEMNRLTARNQEPLTPELEYQAKQLRSAVHEALTHLTPREERVVRLRFVEEMTLEEVAQQFNVTRERIREIEAKALRKLKHPAWSRKIFAAAGFVVRKGDYGDIKKLEEDVLKAL